MRLRWVSLGSETQGPTDTDPANNSSSLCMSKSLILSTGVLLSSDLKARKAQKNNTRPDLVCQICGCDVQKDFSLTFIAGEFETGPELRPSFTDIVELQKRAAS